MKHPPTVVFVLAARAGERYSARTGVALAALRASNPRVRAVIVCDRDTDASLRDAGAPLVSQADRWLTFDTPPGDAAFQSRFLKTTLRSRLDGPFLYIDSDVFVRGPLDEIFSLDCDVAGAPNHSRDTLAEQIWEQDEVMLRNMGWAIGSEVYINGGVLFWNDTMGARRLADEWHRRWALAAGRHESVRDQPAFNSALLATSPRLAVLDHRYNAQVFTSPRVATDAVAWHFYAADDSRIPERYNALVDEVVRTGTATLEDILAMVACREPWSPADLQDLVIKSASLHDQVFALQAERSDRRRQLLETAEALGATQAELRGPRAELRDTKATLQETTVKLQDTTATLRDTTVELRVTTATLQDTTVELQDTKAELGRTQAELQDTDAKLHAATAELQDTRARLLAVRTDMETVESTEHSLRLEFRAVQERELAARAELLFARQEVMSGHAELAKTSALLTQILSSKSWWLTRPLRAMDAMASQLRRGVLSNRDEDPPSP